MFRILLVFLAVGAAAGSTCDARSLITKHEGSRSCVYIDTTGNPTVGIGYNLNDSTARSDLAAVGADYDKVRAGTECLTQDQIMKLFEPSYQRAVSSAESAVSSFNSLCCNVQEVITDMSYNLGSLSSFTTFVSLINSGSWAQAAQDGRGTAWCSQVGSRCSDDMDRVSNGCGSPAPPAPSPSNNCCSCVNNGGGMACASRCSAVSSACDSCVSNAGGKACASRCGCTNDNSYITNYMDKTSVTSTPATSKRQENINSSVAVVGGVALVALVATVLVRRQRKVDVNTLSEADKVSMETDYERL